MISSETLDLNEYLMLVFEITSDELQTIEQPIWSDDCDEWSYHVPQYLQDVWDRLSTESKIIAYTAAKDIAANWLNIRGDAFWDG